MNYIVTMLSGAEKQVEARSLMLTEHWVVLRDEGDNPVFGARSDKVLTVEKVEAN